MKSFIASVLISSLMTITGCGDKGTPGGPGVNNPNNNNKPAVGTADDTFTLDVPNTSTTLKQGETKSITIGIRRGKNFDENVALKLSSLPNGVTAVPSNGVINRGETEVKINLVAAIDAAIGDFVVKVNGDPNSGADAHNEFKITVEQP